MKSSATTVDGYVAALPADRREIVARVLEVIRKNIPAGYDESILWGMPCWSVPLSRYPNTYNKQPLMIAALAAQKNHYAVYLVLPDQKPWFVSAYKKTGKRMDMGGSCVRFKKLEELPLALIGEAVAKVGVEAYLAYYERVHGSPTEKARVKSEVKAAVGSARTPTVKRVAKTSSTKAVAVRAEARKEAVQSKAGTVRRAKKTAPRKTAARKQAAARRKKAR